MPLHDGTVFILLDIYARRAALVIGIIRGGQLRITTCSAHQQYTENEKRGVRLQRQME